MLIIERVTTAINKERKVKNVELKSSLMDFMVEFASKLENKAPVFDKSPLSPKIHPLEEKDIARYTASVCFDSVLGHNKVRKVYVLTPSGSLQIGAHFILEHGTFSWHVKFTEDGSLNLGLTLIKPGIMNLIDTGFRLFTRPMGPLKMRSQWRMDQVRFIKTTQY